MIERTLVLIKPDGVQRCLLGKVLSRFEDAGMKIVGMKMVWVDKDFAGKHYTDDISKRRGEKVREMLLEYVVTGPIVVMVLEGVDAVSVVRKICGETAPADALPGTIRGDFAHVSFAYGDKISKALRNIVHASGNKKEAKQEIKLWFDDEEMHSYKTVHDAHVLLED